MSHVAKGEHSKVKSEAEGKKTRWRSQKQPTSRYVQLDWKEIKTKCESSSARRSRDGAVSPTSSCSHLSQQPPLLAFISPSQQRAALPTLLNQAQQDSRVFECFFFFPSHFPTSLPSRFVFTRKHLFVNHWLRITLSQILPFRYHLHQLWVVSVRQLCKPLTL